VPDANPKRQKRERKKERRKKREKKRKKKKERKKDRYSIVATALTENVAQSREAEIDAWSETTLRASDTSDKVDDDASLDGESQQEPVVKITTRSGAPRISSLLESQWD